MKRISVMHRILIGLCFIFLCGCGSTRVELGVIYAGYNKKNVSPVVIVHGIEGADLKNSFGNGDFVWGNPRQFLPETYEKIKFDLVKDEIDKDLRENTFKSFYLKNDICASDILSDIQLIGGSTKSFKVNIYNKLSENLEEFGGYKRKIVSEDYSIKYLENGYINEVKIHKPKENPTDNEIFIFYYDWRRDNVLNAVNLAKFLNQIEENYYRGKKVKFNIVAHSMGGLITKFYLSYPEFCNQAVAELDKLKKKNNSEMKSSKIYKSLKAEKGIKEKSPFRLPENIGKVILLGTPNKGSMEMASLFLTGDTGYNIPPLKPNPVNVIKSIGTMPSTYQLLPQMHIEDSFNDLRKSGGRDYLKKIDKEAQGKGCEYAFYNDEAWEKLDKHISTDILYILLSDEDKQKEMQLVKKFRRLALARAQEFANALREKESSVNKKIIMMGADCSPTLKQGMITEEGFIFDKKAIEDIIINRITGDDKEDKIKEELIRYFPPGDGTVTRENMLGYYGSDYKKTMFFCEEHLKLVQNLTVMDNILFELLAEQKTSTEDLTARKPGKMINKTKKR